MLTYCSGGSLPTWIPDKSFDLLLHGGGKVSRITPPLLKSPSNPFLLLPRLLPNKHALKEVSLLRLFLQETFHSRFFFILKVALIVVRRVINGWCGFSEKTPLLLPRFSVCKGFPPKRAGLLPCTIREGGRDCFPPFLPTVLQPALPFPSA